MLMAYAFVGMVVGLHYFLKMWIKSNLKTRERHWLSYLLPRMSMVSESIRSILS